MPEKNKVQQDIDKKLKVNVGFTDQEQMAETIENKSDHLLNILNEILVKYSYSDIAKHLNVAIGTVKRWNDLKRVPKQYTFELMKLANMDVDYSLFSYKEKDQFFTPSSTANYCYSKFVETIIQYGESESDYYYVEPSAGSGSFLKYLPKDRKIGFDIEPRCNEIVKQDFLEWKPSQKRKFIVIGNPPFGLRGQLALKFINHSSDFADFVCFILPQLFESDGKGSPRKRIKTMNLIHSEKLDTSFETPHGKDIEVECIFQIWSKYHENNAYSISDNKSSIVKVYSLSDGGTSSSTRNKKMLLKCDAYLPSTCFGKENMRHYDCFEMLPGKKGYGVVFTQNKYENITKFKTIDWSNIAFLSTNSAYNIRCSQIIGQFQV